MYSRYPRLSFANVANNLVKDNLDNTEMFWIRDAQTSLSDDFARLSAKRREDGIIVVGTRAEAWMEMSYNQREVILLPYSHRISRLYTQFIHNIGHFGIAMTASKVRRKFWIIKLQIIAKSVRRHCVPCNRERKIIVEQIMSALPIERLRPAPAWHSTSLDYFGPYEVKGEVNKRARSKAYGLIFNCMQTWAIHIELCPDYSTDKFLCAFRRFVAIRGYPKTLFSEWGSQLVSADKQLRLVIKDLDWSRMVHQKDWGGSLYQEILLGRMDVPKDLLNQLRSALSMLLENEF